MRVVVSSQLALETIEPVLDAGGIGDAFGEQIERVLARRLQILEAMLVMDRERFLGLAPQRRGASRQHRQLVPRFGGFMRPAIAPADPRQAAQRLAVHFRFRADALREFDRPQQRRLGVFVGAAPLVNARQPVGFLRRGRRRRSARDQHDRARQHRGQRDQVEAVVLHHRFERPRIAGADELEEARRDLVAGHVADTMQARDLFLEHASEQLESSGSGVPVASGRCRHIRRAGCSMSRCGTPSSGHGTRWNMNRVSISGTSKRAAVVGAEGAMRLRPRLHLAQHRALVLEAGQQELPDANRGALDRRAADQEGLRAGAAEESGGLEIEEQQRFGRRMPLREPASALAPSAAYASSAVGDRRDDLADRRAAVAACRRDIRDRR